MTAQARREAERRGRRAEDAAAMLLRAKGFRILARRYRTPAGEIDLIVRRRRRIAFVEVKERESTDSAAWAITPRQRARLVRAAEAWLARHPPKGDFEISIDVVLVAPWGWPRHIVSAFDAN